MPLPSRPRLQIPGYNVAGECGHQTPNTRVAAIKLSYPSAWLVVDVQSVQSAAAVTRYKHINTSSAIRRL